MLYRLNDEFVKIEEAEGLMQNLSKDQSVELVTCIENPQKDSGVVLQPKEKLKFTVKPDEFIYARCVENGGVMANLSVVNLAFASNANIKHDHDDRYYTEAEIDKLLAQLDFNQINDSEILTTKTWSSDKISKVLNKYYAKEEIDKLLQALNYCEIDDSVVVSNKTWSSQKISSDFNEKADKNHTHKEIVEELKGDIEEATQKSGINLLKRNKAYVIGDIAYSSNLPGWVRLECITAGTTAGTEPSLLNITQAGILVTDGTVVFIVDDVREGNRVGNIVMRHTLCDGFVKANGAVLVASDYPRLKNFVVEKGLSVSATEWQAGMHGLYVYDETADTLKVPDVRAMFIRGLDDGRGIDENRGLGSTQESANKSHVHYTSDQNTTRLPAIDGTGGVQFLNLNNGSRVNFNADIQPSGGKESRPYNIALIAQIKY
ncbi:hypothetical protein [Anaerosinus gibii]|uniref:Phage tail collar domain-containing protein n=1 Tax=Selenobaculum gibii TaxID=3054208 RepID=A0A9Y2AF45_9FIRM|nr:hypothetical protein [Selenobaculum gbiensis]WIW70450.1 hypothetical protein P3F81_11255 [Selenobaculum gbiensis]